MGTNQHGRARRETKGIIHPSWVYFWHTHNNQSRQQNLTLLTSYMRCMRTYQKRGTMHDLLPNTAKTITYTPTHHARDEKQNDGLDESYGRQMAPLTRHTYFYYVRPPARLTIHLLPSLFSFVLPPFLVALSDPRGKGALWETDAAGLT